MIDFDILKRQNNLITDGDKIYVKPIDEYSFSSFPIEDLTGAVIVTLEEYLGLRSGYYKFNTALNGIEVSTIETDTEV